jgi:hypothetical protein
VEIPGFSEGTYIIKRNNPDNEIFEAKIPETVLELVDNMTKYGITLYF